MPDEQLALDNVSFEIADGEKIAVIGHTGSGKSTLMQHLNGIIKPSSGQIIVGDNVRIYLGERKLLFEKPVDFVGIGELAYRKRRHGKKYAFFAGGQRKTENHRKSKCSDLFQNTFHTLASVDHLLTL